MLTQEPKHSRTRKFDRMIKELGLSPQTSGKEQTAPGWRKLIMQVMLKSKAGGVDFNEVLDVVRAMGNGRRVLPYKTDGRTGLVRAVLARCDRKERMAVNALVGLRPSHKNEFGHLSIMHPLSGDWQMKLMGVPTKSERRKKRQAEIEKLVAESKAKSEVANG